MTKQSRIFFLTQIAECFEKEHMDTEAEVIRSAIYDIGILDEVKKERDAAIAMAQGITRCKDCRYAHLTYGGECKYCDTWTDVDGYPLELYVDGEFYCGNAERRTDAKTS